MNHKYENKHSCIKVLQTYQYCCNNNIPTNMIAVVFIANRKDSKICIYCLNCRRIVFYCQKLSIPVVVIIIFIKYDIHNTHNHAMTHS